MKFKLVFIIILIIAVLGIGGVKFLIKKKQDIPYKEVKVERGSISLVVTANGVIKPRNRLEIKPPLAGRLEEILVREGSRVRRGDIIAWMSSTERAALLDTARAKGKEELDKWKDVYKPTPVIAPLTGFIIKRDVEPGQTVGLQDAVLVMADDLIVQAQVDETDMGKLKNGQLAEIVLDAYPDKIIPGKIEHIAYESQVINNVTIYQVDIVPFKKLKVLRSGMSADIEVTVKKKDNVLLLPYYAVNDRKGKKFVLLKAAGEEPLIRKIKTGIDDGENMEIITGLSEGDTVLVGPPPDMNSHSRRRFGLPGMGGKSSKK